MAEVIQFKGERIELLDRDKLLFVYDKSLKQDNWILNTFYKNKRSFADTDEVNFAELDNEAVLAPFVEAHAKARQIGTGGGYKSQLVPAAYLKPSRAITTKNVSDDFVVAILNQYGAISERSKKIGSYSNAEKLRICQTYNFMLNRKSIENRKVLMALDVLFNGFTEYSSDDFAYIKADFGRAANMTYPPAKLWSDATANVVKDFDAMLQRMFDEAGVQPSIILTTSQVFNAAVKNEKFKERFTKKDGTNTADNTLTSSLLRTQGATLKGTLDNMQWWTFDGMHNLKGTQQHYVPADHIYMIADTNGTQCQCQIKHLDVYGAALDFYDYTDSSKNPSVLEQICDSAPLLAPSMSNGVIKAKVL